jgi:hypothetical protein
METKNMPDSQWNNPKPVTDLDLAFPSHVIGSYLPLEKDIPKEFWKCHNTFNEMSESIFLGTTANWGFQLNQGIDLEMFKRHIKTCLGSFEPKHEHKIAGVAYLLSLWCSEVKELA